VHYALGYQGSGVSLSLYAGKLLAHSIGGHSVEHALPALHSPLARYPLHRFIRIPQRLMYLWYRHLDSSD
jgi:taurine dehydrogenase large subunit